MSNSKNKPDGFHYQEMIQMANVQMHVIDELMDTHLVADVHMDIREQLHKASECLYAVYNLASGYQSKEDETGTHKRDKEGSV